MKYRVLGGVVDDRTRQRLSRSEGAVCMAHGRVGDRVQQAVWAVKGRGGFCCCLYLEVFEEREKNRDTCLPWTRDGQVGNGARVWAWCKESEWGRSLKETAIGEKSVTAFCLNLDPQLTFSLSTHTLWPTTTTKRRRKECPKNAGSRHSQATSTPQSSDRRPQRTIPHPHWIQPPN